MMALFSGLFFLSDTVTVEYTNIINPYSFGVFFIYIVFIILLSVCTAKTVKIWHWVIGSPSPNPQDPKTLNYQRGRIMSWVGRWLKVKYDTWESKWDSKVKQIVLEEGFDFGCMEYIQRFEEIDEFKRPPNPYKALGGCLICFSFYPTYLILTLTLTIIQTTLIPLPLLVWVLGYILFWGLVVAVLTSEFFD